MTDSLLVAGLIGAGATGVVSLILFFITQYFRGRDKRVDRNEDRYKEMSDLITKVRIDIAGISHRLDDHTTMLTNLINTSGHMSRQIDALFRVVDAPKRTTDNFKGVKNGG